MKIPTRRVPNKRVDNNIHIRRQDGSKSNSNSKSTANRIEQLRRRPSLINLLLIVFMVVIFTLRQSSLSTSQYSLDEMVQNPSPTAKIKAENAAEDHPAKSSPSLPLTFYSYNTTDVEEFKRLHRKYLIEQQQRLDESESYLSTKAKGKRKDGTPITTYSYAPGYFFSGFRNQIMALVIICIRANLGDNEQLLLDSLMHKDTYGTDKYEPFEFFFDVEHWNRYSYNEENPQRTNVSFPGLKNPDQYPNRLPRLVYYDPALHDQWNPRRNEHSNSGNATRPYTIGLSTSHLFLNYMRYVRGKGPFPPQFIDKAEQRILRRNPAEILMLQGALKPHPALQAVVDRSKDHLRKQFRQQGSHTSTGPSFRYMTLHARVEPDMQKHVACKDKKVIELQDILEMIESKWPETPPVDAIFLPINRQVLEAEGTLPENYKSDNQASENINWVAVRNLELLNRITNHKNAKDGNYMGGLWNGTVPVVEFGSEALRGTVYENRPSTSGAILNFFLGLDANIFVGTEVSSFSHDILNTRFYRGLDEDSDTDAHAQPIDGDRENLREHNYKFIPGGLEKWITDDMTAPPGFQC